MATQFPPSPPSQGASLEPLPWENPSFPALEGLYETAKLVLLKPREAFARMSSEVSLGKPVLFALILGWVGIFVAQVYGWVFRSTMASLMPGFFPRREFLASKLVSVATVLAAPLWILLSLAIVTVVVHLFLLLYGGAHKGLEMTFRTLAYSEAVQLFQVVPLVGGLVALFWWLAVVIPGLAQAHGTTAGRAAGAVLTPLLLCCVCLVAVLAFAGAALFSALGR
jgi:hypothetical protein